MRGTLALQSAKLSDKPANISYPPVSERGRHDASTSVTNTNTHREYNQTNALPWFLRLLPATTAEDDEQNDEDEENSAGDPDDDRQLLLVEWQDPSHTSGGVKGEGDLLLAHAPVVDRDTGVGAQVTGGHPCYRQTVVQFNSTWKEGCYVCFEF